MILYTTGYHFPLIAAIGMSGATVLIITSVMTAVLIKNTKQLKQKKITKLILSLALANCIIGVLTFYCYMYRLSLGNASAIKLKISIKHVRVVFRYLHIVSVSALCCLSLDRYLALCHPVDYQTFVTARHCRLLAAVTWITPFLLLIIPLTLDYLEIRSPGDNMFPWRSCILLWILYLCTWVWHGVIYQLLWREFRRSGDGTQDTECEDRRANWVSARDLLFIILLVTVLTLPDMVLELSEVVKGDTAGAKWPSLMLLMHQMVVLPLYAWRNPDAWAALTARLS